MGRLHSCLSKGLLLHGVALALLATACSGTSTPQAEAPANDGNTDAESAEPVDRALAEMYPTPRSDVSGTIVLRMNEGALLLNGRLNGLPAGSHTVAIHEKGDCSAHDAKSVGGLFNPTGDDPPAGMLGDVKTVEPGQTEVELTVPGLHLAGGESVLGRALVVHAWPYDASVELEKVPYLACGVIRAR